MVVCFSLLNYSPRNNSGHHSISLALIIIHLIFPSHVGTSLEAGNKFKINLYSKTLIKSLPFQCRHVIYRYVAYRDDD